MTFRITENDYDSLEDGNGKRYGRAEDGTWCWLTIFNYSVTGYRVVTDPEVVKLIEEELYS